MAQSASGNGYSREQNKGGILLTAILFLVFFSGILLIILEDYRVAKDYYLESKDFFTAKIMMEMFLEEYYTSDTAVVSPVEFSAGTLTYKELDQLEIKVYINGNTLTFHKELKD